MRKSLILIITFISTLILIGIYHSQDVQAVQSDISGETSGGKSATLGSATSGNSLYSNGAGIKVSLVYLDDNRIIEKDNYYYIADSHAGRLAESSNLEGKYYVCGVINDGEYKSNCINVKNKYETISDSKLKDKNSPNYSTWGLMIDENKIKKYIENKSNLESIMNKFTTTLKNEGIITTNTFDLDKISKDPEALEKIRNYRIIAEPLYLMSYDYDGSGNAGKFRIATSKAWAKVAIQEVGNSTYRLNNRFRLGVQINALAKNVYATEVHGIINKKYKEQYPTSNEPATSKINAMSTTCKNNSCNLSWTGSSECRNNSCFRDYYKQLADVSSGFGYGVFYVLGECDETKSCCYDESGKYHGEYFGEYRKDSNGKILPNYKIEDGKVTSCLPCDKTKGCCYDENGVYQPNFKEDEGAYKNINGTLKECEVSDKPKRCFEKEETKPLEFKCNENSRTNTSKFVPDEPISINKTIYSNEEGYEDISNSKCGLDETTGLYYVDKKISGEIQITQNVTQTIERDDSVKAGSGFTLNATYTLTSSYETCGIITVKITDRYWDEDSQSCENIEKTKYIEYKDEDLKKLSETNPDIRLFLEEVQEQVESKTEVLNGMNAQTKTYSSNVVENHNSEPTTTMGKWTIEEFSSPEIWYPSSNPESEDEQDKIIKYTLSFKLQNACIDRQTAEVTYTDGSCNEETHLNGGQLYYVPVKQENGTTFPYKISIDDLSIIKGHTWSLNYTCGVNCVNELIKNGKYKIIYRPIKVSNPFDKKDLFPKWTEREKLNYWNWYNFMNLDESIIENKISRNKLEYEINLYPETIKNIKRYNTGKNYTSLTTINRYGTSTFLNGEEVKLDIQKRPTVGLNNYNHLGECKNNCWMGGGKQE